LVLPSTKSPRFDGFWAAALIVLAGVAAYADSLSGPFVYDDKDSVLANQSIRHLATAFWPDHGLGQTVEARPVLNLSLALDYALGRVDVRDYHLTNLLIHLLAALTLFGLVRRTIARWSALSPTRVPADGVAKRVGDNALHLAFFIALLWTLHPLQTESVTYIIQRAESLTGLFFLFTFYAFVRSLDSVRPGLWRGLCVGSFLLGIGTKEIMVCALPLLWLYDATFVSGSLAKAWRSHRSLFLVLAAGLGFLAALVASTGGNRSGTIGLGVRGSPLAYAFTQPLALLTYLKLCFLPFPLVFDYGTFWTHPDAEFVLQTSGILLLLALTAVALKRAPALGFIGAWFFVILAPTSVAPGTSQMIVEHRMYLPLAAVVALMVLGLHRLAGNRSFPVLLALAAAWGGLTFRHNEVYRTEEGIWSDTVAHRPNSEQARCNLGNALSAEGRNAEAVVQYQEALRLNPEYADAHYNLGIALNDEGRTREAIAQYEEALRLKPRLAAAHYNLGVALEQMPDRSNAAVAEYEEALRLRPDYAAAHNNLGNLLSNEGRTTEAIVQYREALRLQPDDAKAHYNLGSALGGAGRNAEAIVQYQEALRLQPDYAEAHNNLGNLLGDEHRNAEAITQYEEALRLRPNYLEARNNLGGALNDAGRTTEAVVQYQEALRLRPDLAVLHFNLAAVLLKIPGRTGEAAAHLREVLRLQPDNEAARQILTRIEAARP
jgi:tetratricopeptide (TPR) repeat protein